MDVAQNGLKDLVIPRVAKTHICTRESSIASFHFDEPLLS